MWPIFGKKAPTTPPSTTPRAFLRVRYFDAGGSFVGMEERQMTDLAYCQTMRLTSQVPTDGSATVSVEYEGSLLYRAYFDDLSIALMTEPIKEMPTLASAGPNVEMTLEKMPVPEQSAGDDEGGNESGAVAEENSIEHQLNAAKNWGNRGAGVLFRHQKGNSNEFWIVATQTNVVNGIAIDENYHDVIAYKLRFFIHLVSGRTSEFVEITYREDPMIMFERKSMQEGKKKPNSFKLKEVFGRKQYCYKLKDYDYFQEQNMSGAESYIMEGMSHRVLIHPSIGTSYLIGCKSICYERDAVFDGEDLYPGPLNNLSAGRANSIRAFESIRDLQDEYQTTRNFLRVRFRVIK